MNISSNGVSLIEQFEGFRPTMYKDAVGLPTIGYGTLIQNADQQWLMTATITTDQGEVLLRTSVAPIETMLNATLPASANQNQFDALISFAYNLGINALKGSTLLKKVIANPADPTIADEFAKWVHAGTEILPGLVTRRKAESNLYFS
ncbi:MAG TPA: lysozyme [Bacteroidia bacterium]|jgi:lysozyme|nr:lysozyme [Bacteroidia bacterium]